MATTRFIFNQGGQRCEVVMDMFQQANTAPSVIADVARVQVWGGLRARTSVDCTLEEIQVGDSSTGTAVAVAQAGTNIGPALPASCGLLVTKVVNGARNGRMFWPGLPESHVAASGQLAPAELTSWQSALTTVMTGLAGSSTVIRVLSNLGVPTVVTGLVARPTIGTQRRRLRN